MFPRTPSRRDHPSIWSREAVPRGQRARSRGLAISIIPILHLATRGRPSWAARPFPRFSPVPPVACRRLPRLRLVDYGVRPAPACVLHFGVGGEVAAMWRFGTDADVAVRDQAVRAGGGSRGELMVPLYSARWALVSPFSVRAGGVGATSREASVTSTIDSKPF